MREILFRGKTKAHNKWVYGWYCGKILNHDMSSTEESSQIIDDKTLYWHTCEPETVGQFTGLTDKNGKKIFEGDVLKIAKASDGTGHYYIPPLEYPVNAVVKWDLCAWMWETLCDDKRYIGFPEAWCHYVCEVIGNIHDNPELLNGGAEDGK